MSNTVAIIGAGLSGLVTAKEAVACGLNLRVFEKQSSLGGVWNPTTGKVWDNLRTNLSHYTCMFSDFAWKNPSSDFPNQKEVFNYLNDYATHFDLLKYVQFNSPVQKVKKLNDFWEVTWLENEQSHTELFHHVIVCSGIISKPAPYQGDKSKHTIHSIDYKNPDAYKDKIVTVIGNGSSGCEIAVEVSTVAKHVTHVIRQVTWILPLYIQDKPLDLLVYNREGAANTQKMTREEGNIAWHTFLRSNLPQEKACADLTVVAPLTETAFTQISDGYVDTVKNKKVIIQKEAPEDSEAVIFCTGYQPEFPFFEKDILDTIGYQPQDPVQPLLLHKTVFHPDLHNLGFVGCYKGTLFGVIELQARWITMVFSGKKPYPSPETMAQGIAEEKKIRDHLPRLQFSHDNYVAFADDLASEIGALPDFEKMKIENTKLYDLLWKGSHLNPSYRLTGFGSNPTEALKLLKELSASK